jgi:hypothetical protein
LQKYFWLLGVPIEVFSAPPLLIPEILKELTDELKEDIKAGKI